MHTVVLAGGFGTRLRSVLEDLPKPLAPVGDKCFLECLLRNLKRNGLYDYTFCLHYMADRIVELFGNGEAYGVSIGYSIEAEPMGTAGAVGLLREDIEEAFCVINADTYLELDIQDFIAAHESGGGIATMAVTRVADAGRYGSVVLDEEGCVKGFSEKGESTAADGFINAGLYIFEPEIFSYIPEKCFVSMEKSVFPRLLQAGRRIGTYKKVANFFDIGVPADYESFRQWMAGSDP